MQMVYFGFCLNLIRLLIRLTGDVIDLLNKESIVNFSRGSFVVHLAVDRTKYDHHNAQTIINLNVMSADLKGLYTVDIQPCYHYDGTPELYSLFIRGDIKRQRPSKYGTYNLCIHVSQFMIFINWKLKIDKRSVYSCKIEDAMTKFACIDSKNAIYRWTLFAITSNEDTICLCFVLFSFRFAVFLSFQWFF